MSEVKRLFAEYVAEHRAGGEADPAAYLERAEGTDRLELAALIDAYLSRAPGREWDPQAYAGSPEQRLVERLVRELGEAPEGWSAVLVRLRNEAKLHRDEVVRRLARALGLAGRERKVAYYYNQMEHDQIPPEGVSWRVLDALAAIFGTSPQRLRQAGRLAGPQGVASAPAYARLASGDLAEAVAQGAPAEPGEDEQPLDEVDRLFTGGEEERGE